MHYSRTAITQLKRWYKKVLIKCAILNAAILAVGAIATPANAITTDDLHELIRDTTKPDYSLTTDYTAKQNLGMLAGDTREFTINLNNLALSGQTGSAGSEVADKTGIVLNKSGQKLTLNGGGKVAYFKNAAIDNQAGTVNIEGPTTFLNNEVDIKNEGTLNLKDDVRFGKGITGTNGSTVIDGGIIQLDSGASITQKGLSILAGTLNTTFAKLTIADSSITNQGNLTLTGGEEANPINWTKDVVDSQTTKTGVLTFGKGSYVNNTGTITQKLITNKGVLKSAVGKISGSSLANYGTATLDLTGTGTFSNLTKDATANDHTAANLGGAIYNEGIISNAITYNFTNNKATQGGAIYNITQYNSPDSISLILSGNFTGNQATGENQGNGGAIFNYNSGYGKTSTITIQNNGSDVVYSNNSAHDSGGAVYNKADYVGSIINLNALGDKITFNNNTAGKDGGAIYNSGYDTTDYGELNITATSGDVLFSNNTATRNGGAIANINGTANILAEGGDITFTGNSAGEKGGAIYNGAESTLTLAAKSGQKITFATETDTIYNIGEGVRQGITGYDPNTYEPIYGDIPMDAAVLNLGKTGYTGTIDIKSAIEGDGVTNIEDATVIANSIAQQTLNIKSGSLEINAGNLKIKDGTILNKGTLTLDGGTLAGNVSGIGSTKIAGQVEIANGSKISQDINIASGALTANAGSIDGAVTNAVENGLILTGGELIKAVSGTGSTNINGDVIWGSGAGLAATTIANNGSLDIGTNEANLTGDTTINGTLKLAITDIAKDSTSYTGGILKTTGALTMGSGSTLSLTVDAGKLTKDTSTGDLQLVSASSYEGDFASMIANNRYKVTASGNGFYKLTYTADIADIVAEAGGTSNNVNTGKAWDEVGPGVLSGTAEKVRATLNNLSQHDSKAYVDALTAVAPEVSPMVQQTQVETVSQVLGAVSSRLSGGAISTGGEGISSGDNIFEQAAVWFQGLFNKTKLDDTKNAKGFDADTSGVAFGIEKQIDSNIKAGIGYAFSKTDVDGFKRDTDIDTHTVMAYGEYKPSNWFVNGIATYGWSDYEESKNVAGIGVKAKYDVETFGLQAMTGYDMNINGYGVTPEAGLRFVRIKQDSYKDSADQRVSGDTSDILTGVVGAKVKKSWELDNGTVITPEARVAATYDLMNDDINSAVTLANGSAYSVKGKALDRFGMEFGAGVTAELNDKIEVSVGYEGKFRDNYQDHTGLINAKYKF